MNKKGFTLIELLAVIVILSIIMVIAVPRIIDMIEKVEMESYRESVELMVHTAKLQYEASEVQGPAPTIPDEGIIYTYGYDEVKKDTIQTNIDEVGLLNFKGDKPRSGSITLNKDKKVKVDKLVSKMRNGKYCAIKQYDGEVIVGKSSDSDFNCAIDGEEQVTDDTPCELAQETSGNNTIYYVDSVEDMYKLSADVNSGNNYSGKTIKLRTNLDFSSYTKESKPKVCTNGDNTNGFTPIGNDSNKFSGTFEGNGKTISNLTISRPTNENIGIFGYTSSATIRGIVLNNINVTGANYVGSLIGWQSGGTVEYIEVKSDNIEAKGRYDNKGRAGGIVGTTDSGAVVNVLMKNITVKGTDYTGYATISSGNIGVVENANMTSTYVYGTNISISNNAKVNNTEITNGFSKESVGDINYYDSLGLNTWIAGDNENKGYYFDYENESNKNVVLKTTATSPIPTNINNVLTKQGDFYLIKNTADWKNMSAFVDKEYKFKLANNLDFSNKQFYMMGTGNNPFKGIFDGNANTISNVTVNNPNQSNVGIFGKTASGNNTTKIYGINVENINMKGFKYVGSLIGLSDYDSVYSISAHNVTIEGTNERVAGIVGTSNSASLLDYLLDGATIKVPSGTWAGYGTISSGTNGIIEHANVTAGNIYQYNLVKSNYVIENGNEITNGFNKSLVGDLEYYSNYVDTPLTGDLEYYNIGKDGYYFNYVPEKNGIYVVKAETQNGWVLINNIEPLNKQKWSYFENGQRIESGLHTLKDFSNVNQTYYFENGVAVLGFKTINNKKYYFSELDEDVPKNNYVDAKMIKGRTINIDGTNYTFDSNGVCTSCN